MVAKAGGQEQKSLRAENGLERIQNRLPHTPPPPPRGENHLSGSGDSGGENLGCAPFRLAGWGVGLG